MPGDNKRAPRLLDRRWRALHRLDCTAASPRRGQHLDIVPICPETPRTPGLAANAVRKQS